MTRNVALVSHQAKVTCDVSSNHSHVIYRIISATRVSKDSSAVDGETDCNVILSHNLGTVTTASIAVDNVLLKNNQADGVV